MFISLSETDATVPRTLKLVVADSIPLLIAAEIPQLSKKTEAIPTEIRTFADLTFKDLYLEFFSSGFNVSLFLDPFLGNKSDSF